MAQAMEKKEHRRRRSPARSNSPERDHHSSHRRERSPDRRREKMPERSSDRERNRGGEEKLIEKEKDRSRNYERKEEHDRGRHRERERPIEKEEKSRNSERNREESMDESPKTRRLRRAQEERGAEKMEERESRKERRHDKEKDGREERENKRRRGSCSPERRREKSGSRDEVQDARGEAIRRSEDPDSLAKMDAAAQELEAKEKAKPSFELSGKLAEETNKVRGVALLYTEPAEARKTDVRWRLYVFKGGEVLNEPLHVHRQSCYLFGRERRVADIPTDHPSCSKQHAVLQYRLVEKTQPDGMTKEIVVPCVMDLESTNGTFINDNRIEARRYYELFEKDTIKFGNSSREYVLLHENSTT